MDLWISSAGFWIFSINRHHIMMELLHVLFFLSTFLCTKGAPLGDLVEELPYFGRPPTTHFSGYLNATSGCHPDNGVCYLHYWLAMAEDDASNRPVVLWLNGGPGSSSLLGFLQENGPLLINATGGLHVNPWSWTKLVNLVAVESPVGVGYSYCGRQKEGKACKNTDKYTASASRAALQDLFFKFPELKFNDFYITGESYAGVYIPTLAKEVLDYTSINLKGLAVGDPCTDNNSQRTSMDSIWYSFKYGLLDGPVFDLL
jgi:cathepsin A (carboxypeptidase C)